MKMNGMDGACGLYGGKETSLQGKPEGKGLLGRLTPRWDDNGKGKGAPITGHEGPEGE